LLRLAGLIHILEEALMVYKDIIDSAPNTMEYKDFYQQLKQSNKNIGLIIGKSAVKKGIELNKFFMTTQLYLAGIMDTNTIEAPLMGKIVGKLVKCLLKEIRPALLILK